MDFKWSVRATDSVSVNLSPQPTRGDVCLLITIIQHCPSEALIKKQQAEVIIFFLDMLIYGWGWIPVTLLYKGVDWVACASWSEQVQGRPEVSRLKYRVCNDWWILVPPDTTMYGQGGSPACVDLGRLSSCLIRSNLESNAPMEGSLLSCHKEIFFCHCHWTLSTRLTIFKTQNSYFKFKLAFS